MNTVAADPAAQAGSDGIAAEMASIWRHTGAALLVLDEAYVVRAMNPAAADLFAREAAAVSGRPLLDFLDHYSREKALAMLAEAANGSGSRAGGPGAEWELDIHLPSETLRLVSFRADRLDAPPGFALVCRDLTGQVDLTARLAAVNQELEGALQRLAKTHRQLLETQARLVHSEKIRSLGQLVSGVAHEINNPLGFIKNNEVFLAQQLPFLEQLYAQALSRVLLPEEGASLAEILTDLRDSNADNMLGLSRIEDIVAALRSFSRLDEAQFKLADLGEGLASTVKLVRSTCAERIHLDLDLQPLPMTYCHPGELNQVFMNLLVNAIQAIPAAGNIAVTARAVEDRLVITIRDDGAGMPPEVLARLGEPFFTTRPVGSGTGLGLAISLGIVERHQGRLDFTSEPGRGTLVTLDLPVRRREIEPTC